MVLDLFFVCIDVGVIPLILKQTDFCFDMAFESLSVVFSSSKGFPFCYFRPHSSSRKDCSDRLTNFNSLGLFFLSKILKQVILFDLLTVN